MKHATFEKAAKAVTCSLLLLAMAAQTDLSMAFGFGYSDEDKMVTVYDGKDKKSDYHQSEHLQAGAHRF